eukprot:c10036_g1_i1.p1 GENE.c10036_g1_i1~~c10036_g1_i1.p1  ORF type:complete len:153 (+),score=33.33 c10036_g1_i1:28-459(+)
MDDEIAARFRALAGLEESDPDITEELKSLEQQVASEREEHRRLRAEREVQLRLKNENQEIKHQTHLREVAEQHLLLDEQELAELRSSVTKGYEPVSALMKWVGQQSNPEAKVLMRDVMLWYMDLQRLAQPDQHPPPQSDSKNS